MGKLKLLKNRQTVILLAYFGLNFLFSYLRRFFERRHNSRNGNKSCGSASARDTEDTRRPAGSPPSNLRILSSSFASTFFFWVPP